MQQGGQRVASRLNAGTEVVEAFGGDSVEVEGVWMGSEFVGDGEGRERG